jgi:hypothetical protein
MNLKKKLLTFHHQHNNAFDSRGISRFTGRHPIDGGEDSRNPIQIEFHFWGLREAKKAWFGIWHCSLLQVVRTI